MRTKVFFSNRTQAVRLPKGVAFPEGVREVQITAVGDARIIVPVRESWADWWDAGMQPSDDFLADRAQPAPQEREW